MASGIAVGDRVYVNTSRIDVEVQAPGALYATNVLERKDKSVKVSLPGGQVSDWISTKYVHHQSGIAIIQFGDWVNEGANLDPLAKGILQNARILYGDDSSVRYFKIRSLEELKHLFFDRLLGFCDKIVVIAHGGNDGSLSMGSTEISVAKFGDAVEAANGFPPSGWQFLCAICYSGQSSFGKVFSRFRNVNCTIGPMREIHSSEMAQFIQTYLNWHLLNGVTPKVAAKYALSAATGNATFRMWQRGIRRPIA